MKTAIYPGSFDPITNGHVDIVKRALKLFDKVYVCVASNPSKKYTFTNEERMNLAKETFKDFDNVEVISTNNLVINAAKSVGANVIVRGLRAVTDFEFELQLSAGNTFIDNEIETIFFMTSTGLSFISSSSVKEFASHYVDVTSLVPSVVNKALKEKYKK